MRLRETAGGRKGVWRPQGSRGLWGAFRTAGDHGSKRFPEWGCRGLRETAGGFGGRRKATFTTSVVFICHFSFLRFGITAIFIISVILIL
jgi:hypothetical protein